MTSEVSEKGVGERVVDIDNEAEDSYRRKVDFCVLPLLCLVRDDHPA